MSDWFPDWTDQTAVIIAGGPSAKDAPLEQVRGKAKFIAVNSSWKLAPWADVLYSCDNAWWVQQKGLPEFKGLKITQDVRCIQKPEWGVRLVRTDRAAKGLVWLPRGRIGWGGNGGFHCINLAVQFGVKRILLVGYDMRVDKGIHWHGKHAPPLNNPSKMSIERWRATLDGIAPTLAKRGIQMINCSNVSALTAYPKMGLPEALATVPA